MKTVEINIGEDALAEIKRAITVNRIAQGGGNHMFVSIAQRIVDAADSGESVTLMTKEDKKHENDWANTRGDIESMGSDV
jgi:hypothetical protein